ncbi:MAG: GDP-mannose 4,6-dehydratase, partial [Rhodospirillaceae bacterium]|nr:GDP-mannose 4,6-dehydratase [Rhodospirillaceae bacterium]
RRAILEGQGCRLVEFDLARPALLGALVADIKPGSIFHLAAAHHASGVTETDADRDAMTAVNQHAAEQLAAAALGLDAALVYASSSQIWTAREAEHAVDEATPRAPSTFYGRTKVAAEEMLAHARAHRGLKASTAIMFNHESAWRARSFVTRKISMAAAAAARGDKATLTLANIGARADWQAASDVVEALVLMANAPVPGDYVIASGRSHAVRDFVRVAFDRVGVPWQDRVAPERDQPGHMLVGGAGKARRELGWRPTRDFTAIVHEMVDADLERLDGLRHD